jgi:hypothetical protein
MCDNALFFSIMPKVIRCPRNPLRRIGPLFESSRYKDAKDPCICFDGITWHIFGSGGDTWPEEWELLHATAPDIEGPWTEQDSLTLIGLRGPHVAAPTVMFEDGTVPYGGAARLHGRGRRYRIPHEPDGQTFTWVARSSVPRGTANPASTTRTCGDTRRTIPGVLRHSRFHPDRHALHPAAGPVPGAQHDGHVGGAVPALGCILDHDAIAWHHNRLGIPTTNGASKGRSCLSFPADACS